MHFGRFGDAASLLTSSSRQYGALRALYPSSYAIDCAARLAARTDRPQVAGTLLGAANRMRFIIGVPEEGSHGRRRAELIEEIRQQQAHPAALDEDLAQGVSMNFDEAVDAATAAVAVVSASAVGGWH